MSLRSAIRNFRQLKAPILNLIMAVFFVQLVESALFILFNYYLKDLSYSDAAIAELTAYRFMGIMCLALPLGLWIKGRPLRPFFIFGALGLPLCTLAALASLRLGWTSLAALSMLLWGIARICLSVTVLPYIILNSPKEQHSEGITLYFMCFSLTVFLMGLSYFLLHTFWPLIVNEERMLWAVSLLGFIGLYFIGRMDKTEQLSEAVPLRQILQAYDWGLIAKVSMPTLLIAIGAGLTIPFINLFFQQVHGIESGSFSLIGALSFVFVALMLIFVPGLQRRYGYGMAITLFQTLAVLALFVMACTEYYAHWPLAAEVAVLAYLLRQPLMNVAGPSTSELSLRLVGERNQEIISALNAAIWSGSWFLSSIVFGYLRALDVSYMYIFFMTVGLYSLAIIWYVYLIRLEKRLSLAEASV